MVRHDVVVKYVIEEIPVFSRVSIIGAKYCRLLLLGPHDFLHNTPTGHTCVQKSDEIQKANPAEATILFVYTPKISKRYTKRAPPHGHNITCVCLCVSLPPLGCCLWQPLFLVP